MLTCKPMPAFLLFIALSFGLGPALAETADNKDKEAHHAQHSREWPGVYNGVTPCDDCYGVKTSLALNKNNSYVLMTQLLGKSPRDYTEKGKFSWSENGDKILLTPRDGSTTRQYLVGEKTLTQLDGNGNRYTGKNAEKYVLRRNDITATEPQHGH